jgi:type II secretory pathway pseudopilin PulG
MRRSRAFTLIEGVVAIVVLAIAVPVGVMMMADATSARVAAAQRTRAALLASLVIDQLNADIAGATRGLGLAALDTPTTYLEENNTGLRDRIAQLSEPYEDAGLTWTLEIADFTDAEGRRSGDPDADLYRVVTVIVRWPDPRTGDAELRVPVMLAEICS